MTTGISGFGFFVQKWPFRDGQLFFKKCLAETPIFISVFWGARFLGQVVRERDILDTHRTKEIFDW